MEQGHRSQQEAGSQDRSLRTRVDASLARDFVRQETRQINAAHAAIRQIPDELYTMIADRFRGRRRLSASSLKILLYEIDRRAGSALNSVISNATQELVSKARPNSVRHDIVHYLVEPVPQPAVSHETRQDRTMRICVFAVMLDQRGVTMSLRETPICFWEHAARRYLVRGGETHDAAVRSIARRLATTYILPMLAQYERDAEAAGTELAIPFSGGLLLGRLQARPMAEHSGRLVTFDRYRMQQHTVPYNNATNFIVKTYVNSKQLSPNQSEVVREMEAWLKTHQAIAQAAIMQVHRVGSRNVEDAMPPDTWQDLKADFLSMCGRLSDAFPSLAHFEA